MEKTAMKVNVKDLNKSVAAFLSSEQTQNKSQGRYRSWNIKYEDFSLYKDIDYLARSLTIYLASWGMMRGSSKLLTDYNYTIHQKGVEIIIIYLDGLRDFPKEKTEVSTYVEQVLLAKQEIESYYNNEKGVSTTDTLLTKILLGVSAATPAYDQYFKKFLQENRLTQKLGKKSLIEVWNLWFEVKDFLDNRDYPPMKIIHMAGFEFEKNGIKNDE